jgi:hypothetical protein
MRHAIKGYLTKYLKKPFQAWKQNVTFCGQRDSCLRDIINVMQLVRIKDAFEQIKVFRGEKKQKKAVILLPHYGHVAGQFVKRSQHEQREDAITQQTLEELEERVRRLRQELKSEERRQTQLLSMKASLIHTILFN